MQKLKGHIPVLDGIRGLAIVMVLIAHFTTIIENYLKEFFPIAGPIFTKIALSGLMGVDLFFVLSGFLITGILLDSKDGERFFVNFYARRFLRIFPLYYGVLFILFGVLPALVQFDVAASEMAGHQWWLWTYLTNFPGHPAWDNSEIFKLGHFWSLSVEEHFYLLWPFVVYSVPSRHLKKVCVSWICFSMLAGLMSRFMDGETARLLGWSTISYSGGLMLGAYCAIVAREEKGLESMTEIAQKMIGVFGVLFFLISMVPRRMHWDIADHYISWFFFVPMIVLAVTSFGCVGRFLAKIFTSAVMRFFGKISYGLYVYHFIVLPQLEKHLHPEQWRLGSPIIVVLAFFAATFGATFAIAWVSWHVYEKQFLKLKKYFEPRGRPGSVNA